MVPLFIDLAIVLLIVLSASRGASEGLLKSVFKFFAWILALVGAYLLMPISRSFLYGNTELYESVNFSSLPPPFAQLTADTLFSILCFIVGFIVIKIVLNLLIMLAPKGKSFLGRVNRAAGALFGIVRGLLVVSFIILAIVPLVTLLDPLALAPVTHTLDASLIGGFLAKYNPILLILNSIF